MNGFASDLGAGTTTFFTVHNQAVHLMPYAGFLRAPDRRYFYQGFIQCDIPTNGNRIDYTDSIDSGTIGILDEQNLLYLDFSAGLWLYRNENAPQTYRLSGGSRGPLYNNLAGYMIWS